RRGAAAPADDAPEILGRHRHPYHGAASPPTGAYRHRVGVRHAAAHEVVDRVDDHVVHRPQASASVEPAPEVSDSDSAADSAALAASSSAFLAASASSAFLAFSALRLEVIASAEGSPWASSSALLNRSSLEGWGSAAFSEPSAPSMPLNFCHSPVTLSSCSTDSVGWAPTLNQYWARSESISMKLGFSLGRYSPMFSIPRPSRRVRASATMIRYCGLRILPRRVSLILTAMGRLAFC